MKIERAIIRAMGHNYSEPFVLINGQWYAIETKPTLLEMGCAVCAPVGDDWYTPPPEPVEHFSGFFESYGETIMSRDMTNDPDIVALAKRYLERAWDDESGSWPNEIGAEIPL